MIVYFNGRKIKIKFSGKLIDLLTKLGINREMVVVFRNGKIITEMDEVKNNEKIEVKTVVFGG